MNKQNSISLFRIRSPSSFSLAPILFHSHFLLYSLVLLSPSLLYPILKSVINSLVTLHLHPVRKEFPLFLPRREAERRIERQGRVLDRVYRTCL